MTTVAILPAKTFERAKQRLSPAVQLGLRRALVEAMFSDALIALRRVTSLDRVFVVTADPAAARIAAGYGASAIDDRTTTHSDAAALGIARARELGAARVLLIAGDCPLMSPAEIESLLAHPVGARSALIVPDRHGEGTNALLLTPPDALTPAFGEGSRQRHTDLALAQGTVPEVVAVPSLGLDIDTPEDLDELIERLKTTRGGAANTRGFLNQLQRSQA